MKSSCHFSPACSARTQVPEAREVPEPLGTAKSLFKQSFAPSYLRLMYFLTLSHVYTVLYPQRSLYCNWIGHKYLQTLDLLFLVLSWCEHIDTNS